MRDCDTEKLVNLVAMPQTFILYIRYSGRKATLIGQYILKKDSFEHYTEKRIMSIQKKLNERPREKLNFSTPKCEFFKHVL